MTNPNFWIWTSDWHLVSNDSEAGLVGRCRPTDALALANYINSLDAAGVIDTGDCKDHYGDAADEHDNYLSNVYNVIDGWATLNSGFSAQRPILPGNHDEADDYDDLGSVTDFTPFDTKFWAAPYHWTCDWDAPQIRFIAIHVAIIHNGQDASAQAFFQITAGERAWLSDELDALPVGWKAIVCGHAPAASALGNQVHDDHGGTELRALLAANSAKITAYINGHRHANMTTTTLDGILHISGPAASYTVGNGNGGFVLIEYLPGTDEFAFHYRFGRSLYGEFDPATYTTVTVSI